VEDFAAFAARLKMKSVLPEAVTERLLKIYGTRAAEVLQLAAEDKGLREPFSEISGAIAAEVVFSFREEMAQTLTDCLWRRTMVGMNAEAGLDAVENAAEVARKYLGWDDARAAQEVDDYRKYVRRFRPRALRGEGHTRRG
jgi:glycerol-3-phosphate dehydrogenase